MHYFSQSMLTFLKEKYVIKACLNKTAFIYLFIYLFISLPLSPGFLLLYLTHPESTWETLRVPCGWLPLLYSHRSATKPFWQQYQPDVFCTQLCLNASFLEWMLYCRCPAQKGTRGRSYPCQKRTGVQQALPKEGKKIHWHLMYVIWSCFLLQLLPTKHQPLDNPCVQPHLFRTSEGESSGEGKKIFFLPHSQK